MRLQLLVAMCWLRPLTLIVFFFVGIFHNGGSETYSTPTKYSKKTYLFRVYWDVVLYVQIRRCLNISYNYETIMINPKF